MKKLALLTCTILISLLNVLAQDKGYIAIDYGFNSPLGNFKSTSIDNEESGFASKGKAISISFAYKLGKHIGLTAIVRRQSNSMDVRNLEKAYEQIDPFLVWKVEASDWKSDALFLGPYGNIKVWEFIQVEGKFGTALINATSPNERIRVSEPVSKQYEYIEKESAKSFEIGLFVGGGLKFDVSNGVCLFVNADYVMAKPDFTSEVNSTFGDPYTLRYIQEMNSFTLGFGIGFRL